ncbi:hypothetical protein M0805_007072 [Coniferiporia weirii]|nr:hypothetical protein M0805_007072 [Coniferiporia weirii]
MLVVRRSGRLRLAAPGRSKTAGRASTWRSKSTYSGPESASTSSPASALASAVPTTPTWSVHALISSYPRPSIAPATLKKLHELAALVPPVEGTAAHTRMQRELEEMVRLVEAVKLVDARQASTGNDGEGEGEEEAIPDGRIWPEGEGMALSSNTRAVEFPDAEVESGRELLKYAARTQDGFYVVETDRRRK